MIIEKVDIETEEVDIDVKKVDIESLLKDKTKNFSAKAIIHIYIMFNKFGFDEFFERSAIVELLGMQNSSASKLLSKLLEAGVIRKR